MELNQIEICSDNIDIEYVELRNGFILLVIRLIIRLLLILDLNFIVICLQDTYMKLVTTLPSLNNDKRKKINKKFLFAYQMKVFL